MGQSPAGVARRTIARVMRQARVRAGIKSGTAAHHAGIAPGTLTKYEKAENPWPVSVVHLLAEYYGLSTDDRDRIVSLARQRDPGWWQRHGDSVPAWFEPYLGLEQEAHTLHNYEDGTVPGLLQTADYARAVLTADIDAGSHDQIAAQVEIRTRRQDRLTDEEPLTFNAVINEAALYRVVGGTAVMREQLQTLLDRAELPNVDLRILPFEAGAHTGSEGSFVIMQFPGILDDVAAGDVVLVEYRIGALYLEEESETTSFSQVFQRLRETALTPEESRRRIQHLLQERYAP
ncbi:helix-turn-helix domain-containing protein [Streptomonospora litoralis]|uniref:HTH cro/C1-type domain-containing protein n=1 Tax=Streptomonospora litoralis TaxID=2498135 RepID=A0A4P6Q5Y9_9ACTN|nr:helix-turn-helix transcriptional regulator [Streptomonospora litoralis]QBI56115.1 hypothetical protein EKD16_21810 [Streptomonospora litoralis]